MRRPSRARGMTLLEIMVAMSILAIVSTLLYSGFIQTSRNKQRIEEQLDRAHEISAGLERMVQELSTAYVSAHRNINMPTPPMITAFIAKDRGGSARIDFASFSHRRLYRDAHESDQCEIGYFVTEDPQTGRSVLARREQPRIDDYPEKGGTTQILIENVKSFTLSFLEPLTAQWVTTWDTTQPGMQPNRLPSQVKIRITVPNLSGHGPDQTFGTRTTFPISYALNFAAYR